MIERIFKNWKTSLVGGLIIIVGLVLVFMDKVTLNESMLFLVGILGLLYKETNKIEKK